MFSIITTEQIINYPAERTGDYIMDQVLEVLATTGAISVKEVAERLNAPEGKISGAVELLTGMRLKKVIMLYRLHQLEEYRKVHPDVTLDELAQHFGFASQNCLYRLYERKFGKSPKRYLGGVKNSRRPQWLEHGGEQGEGL